jgi:lipopolysaccharide transport protein LptA
MYGQSEQRWRLVGLLLLLSVLVAQRQDSWAQTGVRPKLPPPAVKQSEPRAVPPKGVRSEDRVKIYADKAIYKKQEKQAKAIGHVKVIQDNTTIYADEMIYFEEKKQSFVDNGVKIVQTNKKQEKGRVTTITAVKMTAFHQEKRLFLEQEVRMDREAYPKPVAENFALSKEEKRKRTEDALKKVRTVITADQMEYFTKTENANLVGNVVVLQKEKKLTGKKAFIRGEADGDTITLEENAQVTQLNGNWLVENKIIRPDSKDEEQQRLLREKLVIDADKIVLFRATDDLEATGKVKIVQKVGSKERVATGDKATFSDKKQMAVLTGNVRIQRENGDWLTAQEAIFYTDKENFEAIGTENQQVISEFTLDENDQRSSKEKINDPLPDFDLDGHLPAPHLPSWLRKSGRPSDATPKSTPSPAPTGPLKASPSSQPSPPKSSPTPKPSSGATPAPSSPPNAPNSPPSATQPPSPIPTPIESSFKIET